MSEARLDRARTLAVGLPTASLATIGTYRGRKGGDVIPPAIKSSMMLWYDIGRQGCTNEGMAADAVLKDLAGSRNAQCYWFDWEGMSGIGGYEVDFTTDYPAKDTNAATFTVQPTKTRITSAANDSYFISSGEGVETRPAYKVKVTGLDPIDVLIWYGYTDEEGVNRQVRVIHMDGEYDIPELTGSNIGFMFSAPVPQCDITIEILPKYPGGLVFDGGSYARCPKLHLPTTYTVFFKNEVLEVSTTGKTLLLDNGFYSDGRELAYFLTPQGGVEVLVNGYINSIDSKHKRELDIITSEEYNGVPLISGDESSNSYNLHIAGSNYGGVGNTKMVFYSLIIFDRVLTDDEIRWVTENLLTEDATPVNWDDMGQVLWNDETNVLFNE